MEIIHLTVPIVKIGFPNNKISTCSHTVRNFGKLLKLFVLLLYFCVCWASFFVYAVSGTGPSRRPVPTGDASRRRVLLTMRRPDCHPDLCFLCAPFTYQNTPGKSCYSQEAVSHSCVFPVFPSGRFSSVSNRRDPAEMISSRVLPSSWPRLRQSVSWPLLPRANWQDKPPRESP